MLACDADDGEFVPSTVAFDDIEEHFDRAYCERMFECQCEQGRWFESVGACEQSVRDQAEQLRAVPQGDGISYDPACVGARVDALDALGCATELDPAADDCASRCPIFHGERGVDEACSLDATNQYSDCAAGLSCNIQECDYDPVTGAETCTGSCTDPCAPQPGGGCGTCDQDSYCDWNIEECVPLPRVGDSCSNSGRCFGDAFCDASAVCVAQVELGGPCSGHRQCESGYCPAGSCAALPGRGDSCAGTNACADALACDFETQICVEADALICQWPSGLETYY
ncbi:MAG: hypothetical protein IAG13_27585 [Deltaproteobacteria bacterium]|nr:hypothetical protein [Nannocystaceae bacterium]